MKAKSEIYVRLAEVCERAAAITPLPGTKAEMLASAAVWRRLAADFRSWGEVASGIRQDRPDEQAEQVVH